MKAKFFVGAIAMTIVAIPFAGLAATFDGGEQYMLGKSEIVSDDLYIAGGSVNVSGDVKGDLVVAGGDLTISGDVQQDLIVAGGQIDLMGAVGDDLRAVGGDITINSSVADDIVVAGGNIKIFPDTSVGGDVVVNGGTVILGGEVKGNVISNGGVVQINGVVSGDVEINADEVIIGKDAVINGNLKYKSPNEAEISDDATIVGEIMFEKANASVVGKNRASKVGFGFLGVLFGIKTLMSLVAALAAVLLFPRALRALTRRGLENKGKEFIRGFIVIVVVPVALILLAFTVVGLPLTFFGILAYALLVISASAVAGIIFGSLVYKLVKKSECFEVDWRTTIIGVLLLALIRLIPIVGWIVGFVFVMISLGAIAYFIHHKLILNRK